MAELSPQAIADFVRAGLLEQDRATQVLGMQFIDMTPGCASLRMTVREDMLNGHRTCHGGMIAALADSAFAFACNSSNELTVASGFSIDFFAPGRLGDVLTACCTELYRGNRTGIYDVQVVNQSGERVAVFRGRSYAVKGRAAIGD